MMRRPMTVVDAAGVATIYPVKGFARRAQIRWRGRLTVGRRQRAICAPEYVAGSEYQKRDMLVDVDDARGPRDVMPRFHQMRTESRTPAALAGHPRYGAGCVVSDRLPATVAAIVGSLRCARSFVVDTHKELVAYLGSRGQTLQMSAVQAAAVVCWDWELLALRPPARRHFLALWELYGLLQPVLAKTSWPDHQQFPYVAHEWPATPSMLCQQYRLVMGNTRYSL